MEPSRLTAEQWHAASVAAHALAWCQASMNHNGSDWDSNCTGEMCNAMKAGGLTPEEWGQVAEFFAMQSVEAEADPFAEAQADGLQVFSARRRIDFSLIRFLGTSWSDCSISSAVDGSPICDHLGNSLGAWQIQDLDRNNEDHIRLVRDWWGGNNEEDR